MQTTYLINNKDIEPTFPEQFQAGCALAGMNMQELHIKNLAYFVDSNAKEVHIFNGTEKIPFQTGDLCFIRGRKPYTSATALLCFALKARGIGFNEAPESLGHNLRGSKLAQMFTLTSAGLSVPSSFVTTVQFAIKHTELIESHIAYPMVAKQSGSKGEKVWKCEDRESVDSLLKTLSESDIEKNVLFQEYIENTYDIRVIVHYGKIISAIARYADGGFYNNVSQGGRAELMELTEEEISAALTATEITGLELTGVDIVRSPRGPIIFEVNKSPDISAFNEAAGIDIPTVIAQQFIEAHRAQ